MGWVHACQKGEGRNCDRVAAITGSIKPKDAEDFARTKHDGLPERIEKKPKTFREYVEARDHGGMGYDAALDFVLTKLRLPTPKEEKHRDEIETILGMPLKGYGREAVRSLMAEPSLRQLPAYQTTILPALTRQDTTVGRLVGLIAGTGRAAPTTEPPEHDPEPDTGPFAPF